jgi:hypothetical protein
MNKQIPKFMSVYSHKFANSLIMERIIPRRIQSAGELQAFNPYLLRGGSDYEASDIDAVNKGLLEPTYDLLDRGGKRWRPVLGMIYAECFGQVTDEVLYACGLTEIVHNGSLMVDDLEDKSIKRRGQPCTYLKYGEDVAVNTGTMMYYAPILKLADFV